ncbi:hypothetical protein BST20_17920 [Mycobacterium branderi]|uniref:Uncharacterized protein n=1 Tax=Mycobacterium branderi TaxID=43348 RepID=A0AA91LVE7_9MYCO|nr:hypothetical protein BST20_17920 [Mycobacterium branderi]
MLESETAATNMATSTSRALLAAACAAALVGCSSTVTGVALTESPSADHADVALMDTGNYRTTAGPPIGKAGKNAIAGPALEAMRMAPYVTGPWVVDSALNKPEAVPTRPLPDAKSLTLVLGDPFHRVDGGPLPDIAAAHGFIAGFSTARSSQPPDPPQAMINAVLRFPDADAAAAAAAELVAKNPQRGTAPAEPIPVPSHPESTASTYTDAAGSSVVQSFTAHGPFVLYQFVRISREPHHAALMAASALDVQEPAIDRFEPTDPAKLADLPIDPSGYLEARTLAAPDRKYAVLNTGVYAPRGALHFERDPIESARLFETAGVEWVSQLLVEVYQTHNAAGAARIVDRFAGDLSALPGVEPSAPVAGLPVASCFEQPVGWEPITNLAERGYKTSKWHFACVARADRYAYIAYSDTETDVKQQVSAQYRILAGK